MAVKRSKTLTLSFLLLLTTACEISFAQRPTVENKSRWHSIGGIKEEFEDEGISIENRYLSFKGKVAGKYDVAFVRNIVNELARTAKVDVDLLFTDVPGHNVQAYKETVKARDGSIVIEVDFMKKYLTKEDKGAFFKAIVAHDVGHIAFYRNKIPFLLEFSSNFKMARGRVLKNVDKDLKEEIYCDLLAGYYFRQTNSLSDSIDSAKIVRQFDKIGDDRELQKRTHGAPFTRGVLFYSGVRIIDSLEHSMFPSFSGRTPVRVVFAGFNDKGSLYLEIDYHSETSSDTLIVVVCHPDIPKCDEMISY